MIGHIDVTIFSDSGVGREGKAEALSDVFKTR